MLSNILECTIQAPRRYKESTILNKYKTAPNYYSVSSDAEVELRCVKPQPDFICTADSRRLEQVLTNLIYNAFKFTSKEFIEYGCQLQTERRLVFYVRDTGLGIPQEQFDRIFEKFVQLESNIDTRVYEGAGLGLALSASFVALWKGKIWLESDVGVGTTFFFTLPLKNWKRKYAGEGASDNHECLSDDQNATSAYRN